MKAMILSAGLGKRARPLTDKTPKPLFKVGGSRLIEYHIRRLTDAGIVDIVINIGHLGKSITDYLGDGQRYHAQITYLDEGDQLLNTGGGIVNALPYLQGNYFIAVNADIFTDYEIHPIVLADGHAHIVLVDNPSHNPGGDFSLQDDRVGPVGTDSLTFAGIGYYTPGFFANQTVRSFPLADLLNQKIAENKLSGEHYHGVWSDIGTPERLEALQQKYS